MVRWEWGVVVAVWLIAIIYLVITHRKDSKIEHFSMRFWRRRIPELDLFESHATRRRALHRASKNWRTTVSLVPDQA